MFNFTRKNNELDIHLTSQSMIFLQKTSKPMKSLQGYKISFLKKEIFYEI